MKKVSAVRNSSTLASNQRKRPLRVQRIAGGPNTAIKLSARGTTEATIIG